MSEETEKTYDAEVSKETVKPVLALFNTPIDGLVDMIKYNIKEGHTDTIEMMLSLKKLEKISEEVKEDKEIKEIFLENTKKVLDGGKSVDMYGAKITVRAVHTYYDFSECGDSVLDAMYKIKKDLDEMIKQRETEIKAMFPSNPSKLGIPKRTIIQAGVPSLEISEDEFEENICAPIKKQKDGVVISFKKQK